MSVSQLRAACGLFALALVACSGVASSDRGTSADNDGSGGDSNGGPTTGGGGEGSEAGGKGGSSSNGGLGGSSASGGSMGSGGSPAKVPHECPLDIGSLTTSELTRVVAGPNAEVVLQARVRPGEMRAGSTFAWSVQLQNSLTSVASEDQGTSEFRFPVQQPGTYLVSLTGTVDDKTCTVTRVLLAVNANERTTDLCLRVLPPPNLGLLPREEPLTLTSGAETQQNLELRPAVDVTIAPQRDSPAGSVVVPAFVSISSTTSSFRWESHTQNAQGTVAAFKAQLDGWLGYNVLIVPDGDTLAPLLLANKNLVELKTMPPLKLPEGTAIRGHVKRAGVAVAKARLLMRNGGVPSTLGISDATGAFVLRSTKGMFSAIIRGDEGSSLPDLILDESQGLAVPEFGSLEDVNISWASLQASNLALQIHDPVGTTPVAGVEVQMERSAPIENAGTLQVGTTTARPLRGTVLRRAITDGNGAITFEGLPVGQYNLLLTPPRAPGLARTAMTIDVGVQNASVMRGLAAPVKVRGALLPLAAAAGATMQAFDTGASADPPFTAKVGPDGGYMLALPPYRTYRLRVLPLPATGYPNASLGEVGVQGADMTIAVARTLEAATRITGTIRSATGALGGSITQLFCVGKSFDCVASCGWQASAASSTGASDAAIPLSEVRTDNAGRFVLLGADPTSL